MKLTPIEYKILLLLAKNPGRVFSAEEIYERVWQEKAINTDTIMVPCKEYQREDRDRSEESEIFKGGVGALDIRSKSSRKAGIIAVVLLLAFCALSMLRSYPEMSAFLESEESDETMYMEGLYSIGNDLAEGNYILYNEYAKEDRPGPRCWMSSGQRPFDLVRKYMDCAVFAEEGRRRRRRDSGNQ